MLLVNIIGGPGIGKSTCAADIFVKLKRNGINAEYVDEYVKSAIYENRNYVFTNQNYIFGKQDYRIKRAYESCDVVVTDSPILLSAIYQENCSEEFKKHVIETNNKYTQLNFVLNRDDSYFTAVGRNQKNVEEAKVFDRKIEDLIKYANLEVTRFNPTNEGCNRMANFIQDYLEEN